MKKIILTTACFLLSLPFAYSQHPGCFFLKRTENNFVDDEVYNLRGKTDIENRFFKDINAKVEFFYENAFRDCYGFRIMQDSSDATYRLEAKLLTNRKEVAEQLEKKYPTCSIPMKHKKGTLQFAIAPKKKRDRLGQRNWDMLVKQEEERPKLYRIETLSFPIGDTLAERLHAKFASAIEAFRIQGNPSATIDGYAVTFRCVVGDEVRMLRVTCPKEDVQKLSDLCRQIVKDAQTSILDESKYVESLDR